MQTTYLVFRAPGAIWVLSQLVIAQNHLLDLFLRVRPVMTVGSCHDVPPVDQSASTVELDRVRGRLSVTQGCNERELSSFGVRASDDKPRSSAVATGHGGISDQW